MDLSKYFLVISCLLINRSRGLDTDSDMDPESFLDSLLFQSDGSSFSASSSSSPIHSTSQPIHSMHLVRPRKIRPNPFSYTIMTLRQRRCCITRKCPCPAVQYAQQQSQSLTQQGIKIKRPPSPLSNLNQMLGLPSLPNKFTHPFPQSMTSVATSTLVTSSPTLSSSSPNLQPQQLQQGSPADIKPSGQGTNPLIGASNRPNLLLSFIPRPGWFIQSSNGIFLTPSPNRPSFISHSSPSSSMSSSHSTPSLPSYSSSSSSSSASLFPPSSSSSYVNLSVGGHPTSSPGDPTPGSNLHQHPGSNQLIRPVQTEAIDIQLESGGGGGPISGFSLFPVAAASSAASGQGMFPHPHIGGTGSDLDSMFFSPTINNPQHPVHSFSSGSTPHSGSNMYGGLNDLSANKGSFPSPFKEFTTAKSPSNWMNPQAPLNRPQNLMHGSISSFTSSPSFPFFPSPPSSSGSQNSFLMGNPSSEAVITPYSSYASSFSLPSSGSNNPFHPLNSGSNQQGSNHQSPPASSPPPAPPIISSQNHPTRKPYHPSHWTPFSSSVASTFPIPSLNNHHFLPHNQRPNQKP